MNQSNKKNNKSLTYKKKLLVVILFFITLLLIGYISNYLMLRNSIITTGKIIGQQKATKGGYVIVYLFKVKGNYVKGTIYSSFIKNSLTLDSLKMIPNIKIEYSKNSVNYNDIIDKRILK